jgi:hypothetical protein
MRSSTQSGGSSRSQSCNAMAVNQVGPDAPSGDSSWVQIAIAWILVGLPLLWGIFNTIKKALALFR